jgi:PAS domain S-box-containing protein
MGFSFDRKYLVALAIALLTLAGLTAAGWKTVSQMRDTVEQVRHSHESQGQIDVIYRTLLDMESSQRGYLLTREAPYLAPYRAATARLHAQMDTLTQLLAPHPEQAADVARLTTLVEAKRTDLAHAISLRDATGADAALALARTSEGQRLMNEIREVIERIEHAEARTLALHEAQADAIVDQNLRVGAGVIGAGALLLLAVYLLMRRELAAHRHVDLIEARHREALEREIDRRTAELRESSQALAMSEARLRGIFDSATDAILTIDETQRVVLANPAASHMLGLAHGELIGAALDRFLPAPSRERHRALVQTFGLSARQARPMSPQREVSGVRADGSAFPIEAAISHLLVDGQHLYTVILRDITERQRAGAALRESEARLRHVLMFMPEAVLVHSGGRVSLVNEAAQRLFGADESSLVGREPLDLVHPDSMEAAQRCLAALQCGTPGSPFEELKVRRLDGTAREVQATSARIDLHGEVSFLVLMRDVTDMKRAQAELERSEARFGDVLMHLPEPVFIRTDDRVSFVNRAARHLFGLSESEILGRSPLAFCHTDSKARMQARLDDTQRHVDAVHDRPLTEATVLRPDGTTLVVEVTGAPITYHGKVSVIVMLRDVSELRRTQNDLAASHADLERLVSQIDRAQEAERRRIARELHDDLQQKLAAIAMNVAAAGAQLRRDPQRAAAALAAADEQAASAIESTRRIVNDLRPQLLDDLGLVAALQALCEHFSRASGIACRVQASAEASEQVAAAAPHLATCLYRVAQESLNNVAKHARASEVRIDLDTHATRGLTLRVSDDGSGMSAGARRKPGSFGLLGMSERLRMLGGALQVTSAPGQGTTVEASLPCRVTEAA